MAVPQISEDQRDAAWGAIHPEMVEMIDPSCRVAATRRELVAVGFVMGQTGCTWDEAAEALRLG